MLSRHGSAAIRMHMATRLQKSPLEITEDELAQEYRRCKEHGSQVRGERLAVDMSLQDAVALCIYTDVRIYNNMKQRQPPASGVKRTGIVWTKEIKDRLSKLEEYGPSWSRIAKDFKDEGISADALRKHWLRGH